MKGEEKRAPGPPCVVASTNAEELLASQEDQMSYRWLEMRGLQRARVRKLVGREAESTSDTPYLTGPIPVQQNTLVASKCLLVD